MYTCVTVWEGMACVNACECVSTCVSTAPHLLVYTNRKLSPFANAIHIRVPKVDCGQAVRLNFTMGVGGLGAWRQPNGRKRGVRDLIHFSQQMVPPRVLDNHPPGNPKVNYEREMGRCKWIFAGWQNRHTLLADSQLKPCKSTLRTFATYSGLTGSEGTPCTT